MSSALSQRIESTILPSCVSAVAFAALMYTMCDLSPIGLWLNLSPLSKR